MTTTSIDLRLDEAIDEVKGTGTDFMIRCPAHEDGNPSLHVSPGKEHPISLRCFAGCEVKDIVRLGLISWDSIMKPSDDSTRTTDDTWTPDGNASHVYTYTDEQGTVLYEVLRVPKGDRKTFFQRLPLGPGETRHTWKLGDVPRVLYRLPEVIEAIRDGQTVHLAEGEKDVESLRSKGLVATTNAMGAGTGKWLPQYTETLAGADVIIWADADTQGRAYARLVRDELIATGATVEIREAVAPHKDVTALLEAGLSLDNHLVVVPAQETARVKFGVDILDLIKRSVADTKFVIPGTLAERERLVVVGLEGHGKSTLLRMFAGCCAAGIHPFTLADMPPVRVLQIEAENDSNQTIADWQALISTLKFHGKEIDRGLLTILEEDDNSELDLASPEGTAWLHERIHAYQPQLVIMGPLTNMIARDLKDDEPVRKLKATVNSARNICNSAFIMEHHAPHKSANEKIRNVRPYGSSMFLKWPDFGYGMQPMEREAVGGRDGVYQWKKFRWPRVRTRNWPEALEWGDPKAGDLPWKETVIG